MNVDIFCINSQMGCIDTLTLYCGVSNLMIKILSAQTLKLFPSLVRKYIAAGTHGKMDICLIYLFYIFIFILIQIF
jgi:hypothetical protein